MIEIQNLTKSFGKLSVLNDISLTLDPGNCIALIGPNGCGKTTLIKSILGMVIPNQGQILFNNQPVLNTETYRNQIGYMPQIGRYPENMNIGEVINMIKNLRNASDSIDDELFNAYQIKDLLQKKMSTLSGGTTQKISAVLAFMFQPQVLILDEPTAGLDPLASEILKDKIIKEKEKGKLIIITSHLLSELDELVNRVIFMEEGKVKFNYNTTELKASTNQPVLSKAITHILKGGLNG